MKRTLAALIVVCLISCGPAYQGTVDSETLTRQNTVVNIKLAEAILALLKRQAALEQQIKTMNGGIGAIMEWIRIYEQEKARQEGE